MLTQAGYFSLKNIRFDRQREVSKQARILQKKIDIASEVSFMDGPLLEKYIEISQLIQKFTLPNNSPKKNLRSLFLIKYRTLKVLV